MLCILFGIFRSDSILKMILISGLFAFACLIRINNIFFAPLLAFLFRENNRERFLEKRILPLRDLPLCLAAFLCVFLIQFLINLRDFSSPFTWPYVLHVTASQGFRLQALRNGGMNYFLCCNLLLFSFGTAVLLFLKEKKTPASFYFLGFPSDSFFQRICLFLGKSCPLHSACIVRTLRGNRMREVPETSPRTGGHERDSSCCCR